MSEWSTETKAEMGFVDGSLEERVLVCEWCENRFSWDLDRCPHCGQPGLYPNRRLAEADSEVAALNKRYDAALQDAESRSAQASVLEFERRSASSVAVIARSWRETERLAEGDSNGYSTFYKLTEAEARLPSGQKWDVLRRMVDAALFGGYAKEIRFAALSLDGRGLQNYGSCSWVLRESMIAHRSSVFEENSVLFMERHDIPLARAHDLPSGYRASWEQRARLCVAKLASRIVGKMKSSAFAGLLLQSGKSTAEDDFVEVHVGGPMSIRTVERVVVVKPRHQRRKAIAERLRLSLEKVGVELQGTDDE